MIRVEPALVVALLPHGEHAVVARFLSADQGLVAAYVQGGRGRKLRPVLQIGNRVALDLATKSAQQLAAATVHPIGTNMAMLHGPAALAELGIGLDLSHCAATGSRDDLAYVSPKSRQAVSRGAGLPWAAKLLALPGFLLGTGNADAEAMAQGLALTGHFLAGELLRDGVAAKRCWAARERLISLLLR